MSNKLMLVVDFGTGKDELSKSLKSIIGLGKTGKGALRDLNANGRRLNAELRGVQKELAAATGNVTALVGRERELEKAVSASNRQLKAQKDNLALIGKAERIRARGDQHIQSGRDKLVRGAAAGAGLFFMAKAASEYETQLAFLAQKMDLNRKQTDLLGDSIVVTSIKAKQLPETMLQGADFLAGKGFGRDQLNAALPAIGKFSTAWGVDVVDASKAAHASILSLKVPLNQTSKALNIMAAAGNAGGFEVRDMAQHMPALASQLAGSFGSKGTKAVGDLAAALQILEAKTGDGAQAATNLNNMMRFVNTEQGIKKFKKFGVDIVGELKKAAADGKSPLETIARLTERATGGDLSKVNLLFTDSQAAAGARGLVQELDNYIKIRETALASRGLTDKEFTRLSKTSAANWRAMTGALSGTVVTLGTHLLPALTTGLQWITATTKSVAALAKENPALAKGIMMAVAGFAAFNLTLGVGQIMFGNILKAGAGLFKFFGAKNLAGISRAARVFGVLRTGALFMAKGVTRAARVFGVLRTAAMFLAKGVMRAGLLMMANPIVLLITLIAVGIGLAALAIYNHWDTIKAAFWGAVAWLGTAWENIKTAFANGITFLLGLHGRMLGIGKNIIMGIAEGILNAPSAVWNALKSVVTSGIDGIKDFLGIKSPSRLFMGLGGHMTDGMAIGIDKGRSRPVSAAKRLATGVAGAGALALSPAPALAAGGASGGQAGAGQSAAPVSITIHVHGTEGQAPDDIAKAVMAQIERKMNVQQRRSYSDG